MYLFMEWFYFAHSYWLQSQIRYSISESFNWWQMLQRGNPENFCRVGLYQLTFQQDNAYQGLPFGMFFIRESTSGFQFPRTTDNSKWLCWREGTPSPRPQLRTWWCLYIVGVLLCARQMVDVCIIEACVLGPLIPIVFLLPFLQDFCFEF